MKKILISLGALVLILVLFALAYLFSGAGTRAPTQTATSTLPAAGYATSTSSGTSTTGNPTSSVSIASQTEGVMIVRDFLADPDTVSVSPVSKFGAEAQPYYTLGTLPYESQPATTTSATTQTALSQGYEIQYFPDSGAFSIFIYKEPVGIVRLAMAQDLSRRLGIAESDLCDLVAYVRVSPLATPIYAGVNVGFPDCPGAVALPTQ